MSRRGIVYILTLNCHQASELLRGSGPGKGTHHEAVHRICRSRRRTRQRAAGRHARCPSRPGRPERARIRRGYVIEQDLYYDTFVAVPVLNPTGPFQLIEDGETQYGPGDPGYLGGRWVTPDGEYFLCPLLGPGREEP